MEPYQEAAEATRRSGTVPLNTIKYGAGIALGTAGSILAKNAISKIGPLLSSFVPWSFSKKALNKVDPRLGTFIKNAEDEGAESGEIKDFLTEKLKQSEETQPAKNNKNLIEQESPELHQFIMERIKKGHSPIQAGALASLKGSKFTPIIEKLKKAHKIGWGDIVEMIYGKGERALPKEPKRSVLEEETERFERGYGNQQQSQPGNGLDPQVAQIMAQGNEILKAFRGKP
jgi:hypothetical protein